MRNENSKMARYINENVQITLFKDLSEWERKHYTCYSNDTPDDVIRILETAREKGDRVRIFYGDRETGAGWHEMHDVIGTIGRSCGIIKIPLLIRTARSYGGGGILDSSIMAISKDRKFLYKNPKYNPLIEYGPSENDEFPFEVYDLHGNEGKKNIINAKSEEEAKAYVAFFKGESNSYAVRA